MRIAIAGGGLGGLTLARILHLHGIDAVVYEREAHRTARAPGGMLDLHPESGQQALADAGLTDQFRSQARPEGEEHRILDPAGHTLVHHQPQPGSFDGRPEIDRGVLRDLLLDSLPHHTVAWHHRLVAATARPHGGFKLTFDSGDPTDCDILIGADGARSAVRRLLTDATPSPVATLIELSIHDADRRHPNLADLVGPGNLWCIGVRQILAAQRLSDTTIRVGITLPATNESLDTYRSKQTLLTIFDGWHPTLTALIDAADTPPTPRRIEAVPPDTRWTHRPNITLIGDAAHLMPPVGEGANQAMLDAAELATALATHPTNPNQAIRIYEDAMFTRIQAMMLSRTAAADITRFFTVT